MLYLYKIHNNTMFIALLFFICLDGIASKRNRRLPIKLKSFHVSVKTGVEENI